MGLPFTIPLILLKGKGKGEDEDEDATVGSCRCHVFYYEYRRYVRELHNAYYNVLPACLRWLLPCSQVTFPAQCSVVMFNTR